MSTGDHRVIASITQHFVERGDIDIVIVGVRRHPGRGHLPPQAIDQDIILLKTSVNYTQSIKIDALITGNPFKCRQFIEMDPPGRRSHAQTRGRSGTARKPELGHTYSN